VTSEKSTTLGEVVDEITVGFVGSMASEYVDTGVPFLRSLNIEPLNIKKNGLKYISQEFHQKLKKSQLKPGDVVVVRTGKPGAAVVIPEWLNDANCSDLVVIRPGKKVNPYWLAYFINCTGAHHVASHLVGAVQQHFNVESAKKMPLVLPTLKDQERVARALKLLDDKIELNRKMNETLEQMARAIFKSWFIDFDPVHAKRQVKKPFGMDDATALFPDSFEKSEMGEIPKGWSAGVVSELFEVNPRYSLTKGAEFPYTEMADLPMGSMSVSGGRLREFTSGSRFSNGDTLIARITPCLENGKTAFVDYLDDSQVGWGSTEFIVLRSRDPLPLEASYLLAREESFRTHLMTNMSGSSGRQRVPESCLSRFSFAKPTQAVATAFGTLVKPMFQMMRANSIESTTLAQARDLLLPRLLFRLAASSSEGAECPIASPKPRGE